MLIGFSLPQDITDIDRALQCSQVQGGLQSRETQESVTPYFMLTRGWSLVDFLDLSPKTFVP